MLKSFLQFIAEAFGYEPTHLFHKDIGFPSGVRGPQPGMRLTYGNHARQAALDDGLKSVPAVLPPGGTIIEVEMTGNRETKWVMRFSRAGEQRDLILVIMSNGFVKTVWTNDRDDKHKTLKRHLYTDPRALGRR